MATKGQLHEFRPDAEEFSAYMEWVHIFFADHGVPDEKKVRVFLNGIGGTAYGILCSLVAPDSPMTKSLEVLTEKLRDHYEPRPIKKAERFHFHKRDQHSGESITEFVAELCRLAAQCKFEAYLDEALRDRFVCRLRSETIQRSLLSEKELTFASAVEKAKSMEAAHMNAQTLKSSTLAVGRVNTRQTSKRRASPPTRGQKPCHRCGNLGHTNPIASACFRIKTDCTCT